MTAPTLLELAQSPAAPSSGPDPALVFRRRYSVPGVLGDLWRARELIAVVSERNIRVRYKQAALGVAWAVLQPLSLLAAFTIVLHHAAKVDTGGVPYLLFSYIGLLPWTFFSTSMTSGVSAILQDLVLLNKTYFPREILPLSTVVVAAINSLIATLVIIILFVAEHTTPASTTPYAVIPIVMLVTLTVGLCLALSATTVYVRDVRLGLPLVLQFGLFATPVGYSFDVIPQSLRLPYSFVNPLGPIIDALRRTVLEGKLPVWSTLGAGATTCVIALVGGYVLFKRLETNFTDIA